MTNKCALFEDEIDIKIKKKWNIFLLIFNFFYYIALNV